VKFIVELAVKNLARYKRRTIITAVAIAVGLMMYIIVDSMLIGAEYESMRNLRWYETSSVRVHDASYWENRMQLPLDKNIAQPYRIIDSLRNEGIVGTPRTTFSADMILSSEDFGEDGNLPVLITAVDPQTDNEVFRFADTLVEGRLLTPGEDAVVLGSWFAEDLGAKVGYWVTLVTRGNGGFYEAMDMQIVGIVNCPNPNVNRTLVMMPIDTAGEYLAMEGAATEINILLPDSKDANDYLGKIQSILDHADDNLVVYSWEELAKDYLAIAEAKRGGTGMILFLVFIIAAVGISNTMLMAIYERIRELGMMRALGMTDVAIHMAFIIEAGGIGLIGSIFGVIFGALGNFFLVNYGISFGMIMRDMDMGYRIQSVLKGAWNPTAIIIAFFSGVILSMLVAWIPTRRALKMDIPACLRHQ
jgi:ABC-type lipoprotein release transport system permease subunit